jgi:hypothetical protein
MRPGRLLESGMKRFPPLTVAEIEKRLSVDLETGCCFWKDPTKHHLNLIGKEAGGPRKNRANKFYWVIKLNGIPYKRAQLILTVASGKWPDQMVDHIDGDSLNDKATNLRHATGTQNAWNHRGRVKSNDLPMGIRQLPSGKFQARVACNKKTINIGSFHSLSDAQEAYVAKRKELFNEYCPL